MNAFSEMSDQQLWDLTSDEDDQVKADAYYWLGQRFFERKRYSDAVGPATAAKDLYERIGDGNSEGLASYVCACILTYVDRYEEAINYYSRAVELYREYGTDEMVADALKGRAVAFENTEQEYLARDDYRAASNFYLSANKKIPAGICLLDLGNNLGSGSMQSEALDVFQESLGIFQSVGDYIGSGRAHDRMAAALIDLGEMEDAISHLEEALRIFEYINDEPRFAYSQYRLGWTLVSVGEHHRAIDLLTQASATYKRLERFVDAANADVQLAHAYSALGMTAEALDLYRKTKTIYDASGRVSDSLLSDVNSASLMNPNDLDSTAAIYRRVVLVATEEEIDWIAQACKVRLAETLIKYKAEDLFEESLRIVADIPEGYWGDNRQEQARLVNVQAAALYGLHRYDEAEVLLKDVVSHGFASGYAKEIAEAHYILGQIEFAKGNSEISDDYVAKAVALYLASGEIQKAKELSEILLPDSADSSSEIFRGEPSAISEDESPS
ncbi:MAG: tetratricopeptide repeat protein [Micrococcales bacterium]|nr:tetratricopeptide repeat protein [Micrococcales bacterium]